MMDPITTNSIVPYKQKSCIYCIVEHSDSHWNDEFSMLTKESHTICINSLRVWSHAWAITKVHPDEIYTCNGKGQHIYDLE